METVIETFSTIMETFFYLRGPLGSFVVRRSA